MKCLLLVTLPIVGCFAGCTTQKETSVQKLVRAWLEEGAKNNTTPLCGSNSLVFYADPLSLDMIEIGEPQEYSIKKKEIAVVRAKWREKGASDTTYIVKDYAVIIENNKVAFGFPWVKFEKEGIGHVQQYMTSP